MDIRDQLKAASEKIKDAQKAERWSLFSEMTSVASKPHGMGFVSVTRKVVERCGIDFAHAEKMAEKAGLSKKA